VLPSPTNSDYRVLVIRYERIGDMIMATSLIRNIASAIPSGKVDVVGDAGDGSGAGGESLCRQSAQRSTGGR